MGCWGRRGKIAVDEIQAFTGIGISNGCLFPWLSVLGAQA